MRTQSFYAIGSFQSFGHRVEVTPAYIMRLKRDAVVRLERKLSKYDPAHAAIILDHAMAYLHEDRPTKIALFNAYLNDVSKLNIDPRLSGHGLIKPITIATFKKFTRFSPVLTHGCRGSVASAQAAVRLEWTPDFQPPAVFTGNRSAFSPARFS